MYKLYYYNEYEVPYYHKSEGIKGIFNILLVDEREYTYKEKLWIITDEYFETKKDKDGIDFEIEILKHIDSNLNRTQVKYYNGYWGHIKEEIDREYR